MNNPMGILYQMVKSGSPQQFVQAMIGNNQMMGNPMIKNAINMAQSGDAKGMEQLARNLCKQKNINVDDAVKQIKQQFGMK